MTENIHHVFNQTIVRVCARAVSEYLNSGVPKVDHCNPAIGQDSNTRGSIKLPRGLAGYTKLGYKMATGVHDYNAIVPSVCDNVIAHVVNSNALGAHELTIATSLASKYPGSCTIWMDDKDVVHIEVGDNDMSIIIECYSTWRIKVTTKITFVPKLSQEYALVAEYQETMVSSVSHCYSTIELVDGYIVRVDHLTVVTALRAEHEEKRPIKFKYLNSMIVLVRHNYIPFSSDGNSGRSIELAGSVSFAAKLTLQAPCGIKHLNSVVATVTNDQIAMMVTTYSPRTTELAFLGPLRSKHVRNDTKSSILSPPVDCECERTSLDVLATNGNHKLVLTFHPGTEIDGVRAIRVVSDVNRESDPTTGRGLELNKQPLPSRKAFFSTTILSAEDNSAEPVQAGVVEPLPHSRTEGWVGSCGKHTNIFEGSLSNGVVSFEYKAIVLARIATDKL